MSARPTHRKRAQRVSIFGDPIQRISSEASLFDNDEELEETQTPLVPAPEPTLNKVQKEDSERAAEAGPISAAIETFAEPKAVAVKHRTIVLSRAFTQSLNDATGGDVKAEEAVKKAEVAQCLPHDKENKETSVESDAVSLSTPAPNSPAPPSQRRVVLSRAFTQSLGAAASTNNANNGTVTQKASEKTPIKVNPPTPNDIVTPTLTAKPIETPTTFVPVVVETSPPAKLRPSRTITLPRALTQTLATVAASNEKKGG